jgi:hypothetical protein
LRRSGFVSLSSNLCAVSLARVKLWSALSADSLAFQTLLAIPANTFFTSFSNFLFSLFVLMAYKREEPVINAETMATISIRISPHRIYFHQRSENAKHQITDTLRISHKNRTCQNL